MKEEKTQLLNKTAYPYVRKLSTYLLK